MIPPGIDCRRSLALLLLGGCLLAGLPGSVRAASAAPEPAIVDAATLARYVGHYQLAGTTLLSISREGSQLEAQITGQPKFPIFPKSSTMFFWQVVDAQLTFAVGPDGRVRSATVHQNGRDTLAPRLDAAAAAHIERELAARLAAQRPQRGSEAALRKSVAAILAGSPNYPDMIPSLQSATEQQLSVIKNFLDTLGPVRDVQFKGVTEAGADRYLLTHELGKQSQWLIQLTADGKIGALAVLPAF